MLRAEFVKLQGLDYAALVDQLGGGQEGSDVVGLSGMAYHVELDDSLRVVASIDDGGLRAFLPFTDSFMITPNGAITDHSTA